MVRLTNRRGIAAGLVVVALAAVAWALAPATARSTRSPRGRVPAESGAGKSAGAASHRPRAPGREEAPSGAGGGDIFQYGAPSARGRPPARRRRRRRWHAAPPTPPPAAEVSSDPAAHAVMNVKYIGSVADKRGLKVAVLMTRPERGPDGARRRRRGEPSEDREHRPRVRGRAGRGLRPGPADPPQGELMSLSSRRAGTAFLLALALAASGCAARNAYRQGRGEAKKGNWDLAVARLTKALQKDPDNIAYKIALESARVEASQFHYKEARKHLAADELDKAAEELQIAANYDPSNKSAVRRPPDRPGEDREAGRGAKQQRSELEAMKARAQAARVPIPVLSPRSPSPSRSSSPTRACRRSSTASASSRASTSSTTPTSGTSAGPSTSPT